MRSAGPSEPMPTTYERDDVRRLITVTVIGERSFEEMIAVVDRQWDEGTWDYAMFYDLRSAPLLDSESDMERFREYVVRVGADRPRGPVGIMIAPSTEPFRLGLAHSRVTSGVLDVEILITPEQVDAWLARNARKHDS